MEWFTSQEPRIQTALIAAAAGLLSGFIGPVVKHYFDRWSLHHKLKAEHEYEERKKLRSLIGSYHGRVIELAERLNHRLWNLQSNESKEWLKVDGDYSDPREKYYFSSTVYRFSAFAAVFREFQKEAIYIDTRIAQSDDLLFLKFAKALEWAITDTVLFESLDYDPFYSTDHIFRGYLHIICEVFISEGEPVSRLRFYKMLQSGENLKELSPFLHFFDGLKQDENRFRWDRVVVFHLILMAFLNAFGYDIQHSTEAQFRKIASSIQNVSTLEILDQWIHKLGLSGEAGINVLESAISSRTS